MRELQYYRPIIKFYVSENTSNVIDNRGLNILISKIKDNHGLKSRDRNEIKDYLVKHFVKKIISGKLYQFSDEADTTKFKCLIVSKFKKKKVVLLRLHLGNNQLKCSKFVEKNKNYD